ncbi:MAG: ComEC/Rec2 family competence protein [Proteobacteria bacterium]|nr:ComEC/Rec2 family competence protein [Pseudomonadota bacterium]
MHFFTRIFDRERQNFPLWIPVFFAFGVAFYFSFSANFLEKLPLFLALFCVAIFLFILNRSLIILACAVFLAGSFYAKIYEKPAEVSDKLFVDVTGKVESVRKFSNPANGVEGLNLVIAEPVLQKVTSYEKKEVKAKKKKSTASSPRRRGSKSKKLRTKVVSLDSSLHGNDKLLEGKKIKNFVNLPDYQELDREFLDYSNAYQQQLPSNLKKISVNLVRNSESISVNDKISFRAFLQPPRSREFPDDFDYAFDAKIKKIAAYGFVSGEAKILEKGKISNLDQWFFSLREKVRQKIFTTLTGDEAAIAVAFLIGDQKQISKDLAEKIRNSGLSHLLSISGFHLSLAGAIFFVSIRFFLARNEYLALHFDLKKIAAGVAIFAVYFYLKLAGSPLPAQRAFIFVSCALLALFLSKKLDAKRAIMFGALLLILLNPYVVFSISFQLSFVAILVLVNFSRSDRNYFWQIILLSILIQVATIPFLMHHFQNLSLLGFVANVLAIPLASFVVMPLGFLALLIMPLGLAKPALLLMNLGIIGIEKIADFVSGISYSHFVSPWLPSSGLALAIFGLLLICLTKTYLRFVGIAIFLAAFLTIFSVKKPDLIFERDQKFFAVYGENGLEFSKELRASKQRASWMNRFGENEFKTFPCEKDFCSVEVKNKKILVLLQRNKISEICKSAAENNFDVIVNLTKKYRLPDCVGADKIKIDNKDFYDKGTQFLFFENEEFGSDKIHRGGKKKRNDESDFGNNLKRVDGDFEDESADQKRDEVEN